MGRLCHSHHISILRRIVRVTKTATWSHLSTLLSIIGTKLSDVRSYSPICTCLPGTVEMPDTQTGCARHHHHLALFYHSWRIRGFPLASCGIGKRLAPHGLT